MFSAVSFSFIGLFANNDGWVWGHASWIGFWWLLDRCSSLLVGEKFLKPIHEVHPLPTISRLDPIKDFNGEKERGRWWSVVVIPERGGLSSHGENACPRGPFYRDLATLFLLHRSNSLAKISFILASLLLGHKYTSFWQVLIEIFGENLAFLAQNNSLDIHLLHISQGHFRAMSPSCTLL